jgi:hypothetical protein
MAEYEGPKRRGYETNGALSRLNHFYDRWRVVLTLIAIPLALFIGRWSWAMEKRMENAEGALEIIVRAKCVELTPSQIAVTGLDCQRVLRAQAPTFKPESEK